MQPIFYNFMKINLEGGKENLEPLKQPIANAPPKSSIIL